MNNYAIAAVRIVWAAVLLRVLVADVSWFDFWVVFFATSFFAWIAESLVDMVTA